MARRKLRKRTEPISKRGTYRPAELIRCRVRLLQACGNHCGVGLLHKGGPGWVQALGPRTDPYRAKVQRKLVEQLVADGVLVLVLRGYWASTYQFATLRQL